MKVRLQARPISRRIACLGVLVACTTAAGCSGGQTVTAENLDAARQLWAKAGIRDYDLEYTTAPANGHFLVTVRNNEVKKVEGIATGGERNLLRPAAPRYYSIDGIFTTIADELAQLKTPNPFDQPAGTTIVMKFKTNPELGYPEWWRRDIMGRASRSARIDIVKLTPASGALKPEK
jgi:hypothetical protein